MRATILLCLCLLGTGCSKPSQGVSLTAQPVATPKPSGGMEALELMEEFRANTTRANAKYEGKKIILTGVVASVQGSKVEFREPKGAGFLAYIYCEFNDEKSVVRFNKGDTITVEGDYDKGETKRVYLKNCKVK